MKYKTLLIGASILYIYFVHYYQLRSSFYDEYLMNKYIIKRIDKTWHECDDVLPEMLSNSFIRNTRLGAGNYYAENSNISIYIHA